MGSLNYEGDDSLGNVKVLEETRKIIIIIIIKLKDTTEGTDREDIIYPLYLMGVVF